MERMIHLWLVSLVRHRVPSHFRFKISFNCSPSHKLGIQQLQRIFQTRQDSAPSCGWFPVIITKRRWWLTSSSSITGPTSQLSTQVMSFTLPFIFNHQFPPTDENYGQSGIQAFRELAEKNGICIARGDNVRQNWISREKEVNFHLRQFSSYLHPLNVDSEQWRRREISRIDAKPARRRQCKLVDGIFMSFVGSFVKMKGDGFEL